MKRAFIQTFGCQMNKYDSQRMSNLLERGGYQMIPNADTADLILVNSCSVRHSPENKIYSFLGRIRELKKNNKNLIIGVGGCVAQQEGANILKREPAVDLVFGTDNYNNLLEMLNFVKNGKRVLQTNWMPREKKVQNFIPSEDIDKPYIQGSKAYISITKGCDNFCSFCVVPYTRGREVSREINNIILETVNLVNKGIKEVILLGQNVNSYKTTKVNFYTLLQELSKIEGLKRIRFVSPHPKDWNDKLSDLMADKKNICNQLHLPYQSGSNRILHLMRRGHLIEEYLEKIAYLKKVIPTVALSTDLIVGFPTETEQDFEDTLTALEKVKYHQVYAFKYSPRPNTRSAKMEDSVSLSVKTERLDKLLKKFNKIRSQIFRDSIGTTKEVLIEDKHPKNNQVFIGRSEENISVSVESDKLKVGDLVTVAIKGNKTNSIWGIPQP